MAKRRGRSANVLGNEFDRSDPTPRALAFTGSSATTRLVRASLIAITTGVVALRLGRRAGLTTPSADDVAVTSGGPEAQ
jgi:hypothetical protein